MDNPTRLRNWLRDNAVPQVELARRTGLDPAQVSRYLAGTQLPSLPAATMIHRATDGEVPATEWVEIVVDQAG